MNLFHEIVDVQAVLRKKGRYFQCKLYWYGEGIYARYAGSFIRLSGNGGTSLPDVSWIGSLPFPRDALNRPTWIGWEGASE